MEDYPAWLSVLGDRPVRFFTRIDSTNDEAAAWALAGAPEGAVVLAEEQTAGRGRLGRPWVAAPGSSLLMSVILRPAVPPDMLPRVTLMGAVALADVLAEIGLVPRIKWPNDVLLQGRKVAGILAEAVWHGEALRAVVLGIGLNVYRQALPKEDAVSFGATTVEMVLGHSPDRRQLLARLLARVDHWVDHLMDEALLESWRGYSATLGRRIAAAVGGEPLQGVAEAIDTHGALLLRTDDGKLHRLLVGDVTLL